MVFLDNWNHCALRGICWMLTQNAPQKKLLGTCRLKQAEVTVVSLDKNTLYLCFRLVLWTAA